MTPRERTLVLIVLALLLFGGGGAGAYMLIYSPLQDKKQAAEALQKEVDDLETKLRGMQKAAPLVAAVRRASLPPDSLPDARDANKTLTYNFAIAEYKRLMQHLLLQAGIKDGRPTTDKVNTAGRPPVTPELAPKKLAYATLTFQIEINKANLWQVVDFLYGYYQLDLLHQITDIQISRENKTTDARAGLKVIITSEAIALDGVEPRANLITAPTAVGAVAGIPALHAVSARPSMVQQLTHSGALARPARDYSFIVGHDMFYGPVPPYVPRVERPFTLGKIEDVILKRNDKPHTVKVPLSGDGYNSAKVVATVASGSLIDEDALEIDPKSNSIILPAIESDVSDSATSKIEVIATSQGKTLKGSFTVSVEKTPEPPKPIVRIDSAIRLVIVSMASDGTAEAMIKDNANPFRYMISAGPKGIEITKWWQATGKTWKKDRDYDQPPGILLISDEDTATKRTFKVVAIEHNALIVCEIGKPEPAKPEGKQLPLPGKGPPRPLGVPLRQGHAEPIAAIAGAITAAIPEPVYYRWTGGKSLKELLDPSSKNPCRLKPNEVQEILRRVASDGPVGGVVASSGN